jgi:hypothetical protein
LFDYGPGKVDYRTAPGVTSSILTSGVVLAYHQPTGTTYDDPLPKIISSVNPNVIIDFRPNVGQVIFFNTQLNTAAPIGFSVSGSFRYVIIPGGVAGGRVNTANGHSYTIDELRGMTYAQIVQLFNIPANGTNEN